LNGKTISGTSTENTTYALINNNGNLTITGDGKITYQYNGASSNWSFAWGNYTINNKGSLTVENGTIENTTNLTGDMYSAIDNYSGATTIINGGTVSCPNYVAIRLFATSTTVDNSVTINGGEIIGKFTLWPQNAIGDVNKPIKATLALNGGTITTNGGVALYIDAFTSGFNITKADAVTLDAPEGYKWVNGKLTEAIAPKFDSINLTIGKDLSVNFYVVGDQNVGDGTMSFEITVGENKYTYESSATEVTINGVTMWKFTYAGVGPHLMSKDITAILTMADDSTVTYTYSIETYAHTEFL
jgi:hypothetical protein